MGVVGFIIGPVLVALAVTGYKILAEEAGKIKNQPFQR
jgi:predicted PurR-regulated permease PerM